MATSSAAAYVEHQWSLECFVGVVELTLILVCQIMSKVCEKWGQPYETVSNGEKALELYKGAPEKYRCILMSKHPAGRLSNKQRPAPVH